MVIPVMDLIDEVLTDHSLNKDKYLPSTRVACGMGKQTLNRYYNRTDESEMYRIAMGVYLDFICLPSIANLDICLVLHPEFKLAYFKKAKWADDWIETARQIICDKWERKWKRYSAADEEIEAGEIEIIDGPSVRSCTL